MATLSQIITRAYRESQILDISAFPSADQESEALEILNGILRRYQRQPVMTVWLGSFDDVKRQRGQIFRDFTPYRLQYSVPQDCFVNVNLEDPTEVYFPCDPGDGARINIIDVNNSLAASPLTIYGNGNRINGGTSEVISTNGAQVEYFFRRELADWRTIPASFVASSIIPFDSQFDDMFVIELAMRLNPRYGDSLSDLSMAAHELMRQLFNGRYFATNSSAAPDVLWDAVYTSSTGDTGRIY